MRAAEEGDAKARARLVDAFMPSIASVARIYRSAPAVDRAELMQEGVVGLLRALERYDPRRGTPFWGYASWWVRQAMQQLVAEVTGPVVLSDRALRQLARVKDARRTHLQAHGREPSTAELAETTGLTREQVENLVAVERTPRALEEPIGEGGDADAVVRRAARGSGRRGRVRARRPAPRDRGAARPAERPVRTGARDPARSLRPRRPRADAARGRGQSAPERRAGAPDRGGRAREAARSVSADCCLAGRDGGAAGCGCRPPTGSRSRPARALPRAR